MDASLPIKVKLSGRLTRVRETMGPPSAPPVAVPKPLPVPPALDLQGLRKDLSELVRAAKDTDAREKATAAEVAQISVELGVAIAERLLGAEIAANRQRLDQIVVGVLEKMPAARSVSVRGHPGDVALLQIQLTGHVDWPSHRDLLKFRADETCERGRFKVESPDWFVEWDTQRALKELRTALLEETFAEER